MMETPLRSDSEASRSLEVTRNDVVSLASSGWSREFPSNEEVKVLKVHSEIALSEDSAERTKERESQSSSRNLASQWLSRNPAFPTTSHTSVN